MQSSEVFWSPPTVHLRHDPGDQAQGWNFALVYSKWAGCEIKNIMPHKDGRKNGEL